jgi:proteic killer suppression protein
MELLAAETLAEMTRHAGARFHALKGDRQGQFAVNVDAARRLILEPADDPVPRRPDGGIDLSRVSSMLLVEVDDYHDG